MTTAHTRRLARLEERLTPPKRPALPPPAYTEGGYIVGYARPEPPGAPIDYRRAFADDAIDWLEEPIPCPQT